MSSQITIEVWKGVEGPCLILNEPGGKSGVRVAGPKMWGGRGTLLASWQVDPERLREALKEVTFVAVKNIPDTCADCPNYRHDPSGEWCSHFNSGHLMAEPSECEFYNQDEE